MAAISAALVKELRERTGLGMMDCKKALQAAGGASGASRPPVGGAEVTQAVAARARGRMARRIMPGTSYR